MRRLIIALIFFLPFIAFGQNRTYVGLEVGPKFEIYQAIDNGNGLYTKPFFFSPIFGVTLGQELNKNLGIETGFYVNNYGESFRIDGDWGFGASSGILAFQIPLRLKGRVNLIQERLDLVATLGYTFAINNDYHPDGSTGEGASFIVGNGPDINDSTRTHSLSDYNLAKSYGLLETGLALEFQIIDPLSIYLSANYLKGFKRVIESDVSYWINDEPTQTGSVFSNGDYFNVLLGIKYDISNFWQEKGKSKK